VTARYSAHVQAQEVLSQASFYSANDKRLHFGLGVATKVDLEVRWPNGTLEKFAGVDADHLVTIREGAGIVKTDAWEKAPPPSRASGEKQKPPPAEAAVQK
jgi:hypothetical protein